MDDKLDWIITHMLQLERIVYKVSVKGMELVKLSAGRILFPTHTRCTENTEFVAVMKVCSAMEQCK